LILGLPSTTSWRLSVIVCVGLARRCWAPGTADRSRRISQDEIAAYLADHPGSKASDIARELGVVLQTVSSHLYRGREIRFENRRDGWHLRERPGR